MGTGQYRERNPNRKIVRCTNVRKRRCVSSSASRVAKNEGGLSAIHPLALTSKNGVLI
jgi:hypothetical protein